MPLPTTTVSLVNETGKTLAKVNVAPEPGEVGSYLYSLATTKLINGVQHALVQSGQYSGYVPVSVLNELDVETVQIPANFAGLEAVSTPTQIKEQFFEIMEVDEQDDYVEITAIHVFYRMRRNNTLWEAAEGTEYSGAAACRNVLTNAIFEAGYNVASDCTDTLPGSELDYARKNLVEAFLDPEVGICKKYGLSLIRDNWNFYCLKEVGYDRGFIVQNKKNLLGVERKESIENVVTRVAPYGKDASGNIVWLDNNGLKYVDSEHIDDYEYPRLEPYDTGLQIGKDGVTEQNINEKLLEAGQKLFTEDKVDLPEVTMNISFLSLGDTEEYAQYRGLDKVYLYDIVTIIDTVRGYNYSAQVVGVEYNVLTGMLESITLGSIQNSDGLRKIAVWQVPEVNGENIRLKTILSGSFADGAIHSDDIAEGGVHWVHLDAASIDELTTTQLQALAANIHTLIAGSISADDIVASSIRAAILEAGRISANDIDAQSVRAAIISAGKITANDIEAGAITADAISATDLTAINAKLGTATIASAVVANADIGFAQIKDASVQNLIARDAVTDRYYIDKLAVNNAQMVYATVGELVVKASDNKYYRLDIDENGELSPTEVTLTVGEITAGVTSDGKASIIETDLTVTDLSASNMKGITALIDKITASRIDVDELWARQAFINKLMVQDISSNTYIQSTIGNWTGSSTITQTINGLDSRIASLGYGTVYMQPDEPNHSELSSGDIWIQTLPNASWNDVLNGYTDWQEIYDDVSTWQLIAGMPKMFVWDGLHWQEMYDSMLPTTTQTQIQQLSDAITLKADSTTVDALGNTIEEFSAELTIQAAQIAAAVSSVNTKASSYIMWADPTTIYTVSIGDIWIKEDAVTSTWQDVADEYATWNAVNGLNEWLDLLGADTFVWNGAEWIQTSDRATEVYNETRIIETAKEVTILATQSANFQNSLITVQAQLQVTAERISAEVERAQYAEDAKIAKTTAYQTADQIVTGANQWISGKLANESWVSQNATGITSYVSDNFYGIKSGIEIKSAGIEISGGKYVKIKSGGLFSVDSGNFAIDANGNVSITGTITAAAGSLVGGWTLGATNLHAGANDSYVALASNGTYAIWAGSATDSSAPFRVKPDGTVYLTKLMIVDQDGQNPTEFNAYSTLWKLWYATIKAVSVDNDGYCTSMTFSNGIGGVASVNFKRAATARANGWTAAYMKVVWPEAGTEVTMTVKAPASSESSTPNQQSVNYAVDVDNDYAYIKSGTIVMARKANPAYANGNSAGQLTGWSEAYGKVVWPTAGTETTMVVKAPAATKATTPNQQTATYAVDVDNDYAYIKFGSVVMARKANSGYTNGYSAGNSAGQVTGWNDCRSAATLVERYTRSAGTYGGGTTHYVYDSQNSRYISVGNNWYQTTRADAYLLPSAK